MARRMKPETTPVEIRPIEPKTFIADCTGFNDEQQRIAEDTGELAEAVKARVYLRGYDKTAFGIARRIMRMSPEKFADFERSFDGMWDAICLHRAAGRTADMFDADGFGEQVLSRVAAAFAAGEMPGAESVSYTAADGETRTVKNPRHKADAAQ